MTRHWRILACAALTLAGIGAAATTATAQNVPMDFHWDASPLEEGGVTRTPAAFYEVFLLRGADGEAFAASVTDTAWTLDAEPDVVQRICVRAVDADGNASPFSEWSDPVYFESQGGGNAIPPAPAPAPHFPHPPNPAPPTAYRLPAGAAVAPASRSRSEKRHSSASSHIKAAAAGIRKMRRSEAGKTRLGSCLDEE